MRKKHITWQWLSVVLLVITVFAVPAFAGDLNPSAPPAPTMKTLDQAPAKDEVIPPWSQTLSASERFKLVMGGAAVLDKETGLVWEKSPATTTNTWYNALYSCYNKEVGGRKGWRLPTVEELASLVDTSVSGLPKLPSGYPFTNAPGNLLSADYWSATTVASNTSNAWLVSFLGGDVNAFGKTNNFYTYVWCVRGGSGLEVQ